MTCKHENFGGKVNVTRLTDSGAFMADIKINCAECGKPFQFVGVPVGCVDHYRPVTDLAGTELRVPLVPEGEKQKEGLLCVSVSVEAGAG